MENTQRKLQEPPVGNGAKKGSDKGRKCKMKSNAQGVNVSRGRHGLTLMGPWLGGGRGSASLGGLKFLKLVSMRNETKNQQFLF